MLLSPSSLLGTVTAGQRIATQDPADAGPAPGRGVQVAHVAPLSRVRTVDAAAADGPDTVGSRRVARTGPTLGRVDMICVLISGALVWGNHTLVWRRYARFVTCAPLA